MAIRQALPDDAAALLALFCALDEETAFMFFEPGERRTRMDVAGQRERLRQYQDPANGVLLIAEHGGEPIAACGGFCQPGRRNGHLLTLVLGVRRAHWGQGIGGELLGAIEGWALAHGKRKLELTVMVHNTRAIALYRRAAFVEEGRRRAAAIIDGAAVDEFWMGKLLD